MLFISYESIVIQFKYFPRACRYKKFNTLIFYIKWCKCRTQRTNLRCRIYILTMGTIGDADVTSSFWSYDILIWTYFRYSYTHGKLKRTYIMLFFRHVTCSRYGATGLYGGMDFTRVFQSNELIWHDIPIEFQSHLWIIISRLSKESVQVEGPFWHFLTKLFYGEELLAPHPTPTLEYHSLSAVHECLFNIFAATLHIRKPSSPSATWGRAMQWWQGGIIIIIFYYFSHGMWLSPLGTAATVWPIVPAPHDI
jgi:hypothetical protein